MTHISVVVPVYESADSLRPLYESTKRTLEAAGSEFEMVMVDDCSADASWDRLLELSNEDPRVRIIQLSRNFGQHNAVLCGIRAARGDVIITIDDDLQHPPEEIPKLLDKLAEGYDVVYGTPATEQHGLWRDVASRVTKLALQSAMGAQTARKASAFRAFRTQLRDAFAQYQGPFVSIDVLLTWGTTRFASVAVRHEPRTAGESHYSFWKLVTHAMNMVTGFSVRPLQLASFIGFFFTLFGIAVLVYVVAMYFALGSGVPGFPFLASVIAIFSGAQLFALGIIGEYLARMHFRTMDKPPYAVRCDSSQGQD